MLKNHLPTLCALSLVAVSCGLPVASLFADNGENTAAITAAATAAAQTALTGNYIQAGVVLGLGLFGVLMHQAQAKWHNATVNSIIAALSPDAPAAVPPASPVTPTQK